MGRALETVIGYWKGLDQKHASEMSSTERELCDGFVSAGWMGNYGGAVHPGGVYYLTVEGQIELGRPPKWYTDMSPRERETYKSASARTKQDYLTIVSERPDVCFGEHDNVALLDDMVGRGLLKWREDKVSKHTPMFTALYPELTDAGRAALEDG